MPVETFNYINSLDPNNPAGFDSVSDGDDHIRGIKSAIKSTFPNIDSPVTATADDLNRIGAIVGGGNGVFASVKFNGSSIMYAQNVVSVAPSGAGYRVTFDQPATGFDHHYAVLITPFAVYENGIFHLSMASITDQRDSYVEFMHYSMDPSTGQWSQKSNMGFNMLMVDMIQTEANANP